MSRSTRIVRAAVFPPIGIARVGNSEEGYFLGPEVLSPARRPPGFYKDPKGALKRQAVRFRVYGLNQAGEVVRELKEPEARIEWSVHVANKKAAWYGFSQALDLASTPPSPRRNGHYRGAARTDLCINPGPRTICRSGETDSVPLVGQFLGESVYLGELRTDSAGRLIFLGGLGKSTTPFPGNTPTTFADNDGWHDDTSDGPVEAKVTLKGKQIPVEGGWVVTAPPNYAPDIIAPITMWDVMEDTFNGVFQMPVETPSFRQQIYPILAHLSQTQWVNFGFFVGFGHGRPYDFGNPDCLARLADPAPVYREYRRQILNYLRAPGGKRVDATLWPWMYGDEVQIPATSAGAYLSLTRTQYHFLEAWAAGNFEADWEPGKNDPASLEEIELPGEQARSLTRAPLWYCLGGPFHPGCEMTWPMRHATLYSAPFRIRRRSPEMPEVDYGDLLDHETVLAPDGPLYFQGPGDLTRWMAVPWQTDTASCRSGYEKKYDPWLPTFWPARVPNHVLSERDYRRVIDPAQPRSERNRAFNTRVSWPRILGPAPIEGLGKMIDLYPDLGIVEARPGVEDDPDFPATMYVESPPGHPGRGASAAAGKTGRFRDVPDSQGQFVGRTKKVEGPSR